MTAAATPAAALLPAHLRHVVIEGPIGVGKTTLARRLAERLDARLMLEEPEANPFLDRFYRDGARYALPTQMFFLFQRVQQQQALAQPDLFDRLVIGDYLLDKDRLFARLTLDADELRLGFPLISPRELEFEPAARTSAGQLDSGAADSQRRG